MASSEAQPPSRVAEPHPGGARAATESAPPAREPILCGHCGRTASNGISCQGMCVADSGY